MPLYPGERIPATIVEEAELTPETFRMIRRRENSRY
jgi:hypothetical protein